MSKLPAGHPLPGFPVSEPIPRTELVAYFSGDRLLCFLCGRTFRGLGQHIVRAHDMTVTDYQDRYHIPRERGLVGAATRSAFAASASATHAAGKLSAHVQALVAQSGTHGSASARTKAALRAIGRDMAPPSLTRDAVERVVIAVEAGAVKATAVKDAGLSWSGVAGALRRYPDLKARWSKKGRQI